MTNFRNVYIYLLLLFSSLSLVFGVFETAARYTVRAWPFEANERPAYLSYLSEKDKTLRWRYSPNKGGRNSLGLKNKEIERKSENQFRILFLGDSLVWNGKTTSGKLYTQVIEENLNKQSEQNYKFEVINAGIPGYTTYQEMEFLKIYGLKMNPDMVILGFALNDLYYKYLHKPNSQHSITFEPTVHLNRFNVSGFPGKIFSKSYLIHRLVYEVEILLKKMAGAPIFPFETRNDFFLAWKPYGWGRTREMIGEMKGLLGGRDIPLIVVIYPVSDQVNDSYRGIDKEYILYPQKKIKEICVDYDIPYFDLTNAIYENGGIILFADYIHMNDKGNDVVAEPITGFLEELRESMQ